MIRRAILTTLAFSAAMGIMAQTGQAPVKGMLSTLDPNTVDTLFMSTKLGSFKLMDGEGRVEISFTGSVLISQLKGVRSVSGNLRMEYPRNEKEKATGRELWFGTGKIVIDGGFRAIQWFGRDLSGTWKGHGAARLYGEFDNNLNTGTFYFNSEPTKQFWSPYGSPITLPPPRVAGTQKPTIRKSGGGK